MQSNEKGWKPEPTNNEPTSEPVTAPNFPKTRSKDASNSRTVQKQSERVPEARTPKTGRDR